MKMDFKKLFQNYWRFGAVALLVVLLAVVLIYVGGDSADDMNGIQAQGDIVPVLESDHIQDGNMNPDGSGSMANRTEDINGTDDETVSMDLQKDIYPEINTLFTQYYEAKFNCDVEALKQIVNPMDGYTKENLEIVRYGKPGDDGFNEIEGYEVEACYSKPGLLEDTYIVWVHYKVKYLNATTKVSGLMRFYVCTDESGVYIYNRETEGEINAYITQVSEQSDVLDLISEINVMYQEALSSDNQLLQIFMRMQEAASQVPDETESTPAES